LTTGAACQALLMFFLPNLQAGRVAVIGCGPSAARRGWVGEGWGAIIVVNAAYLLAPRWDYLFFSDPAFAAVHPIQRPARTYAPETVVKALGIEGLANGFRLDFDGLSNRPPYLYGPWSTTVQAINFALMAGAGEVHLFGCELSGGDAFDDPAIHVPAPESTYVYMREGFKVFLGLPVYWRPQETHLAN